MTAHSLSALLPHPAPRSDDLRLILFGIRRMAHGGLADAHAAHAFFTSFGVHYRRPLVLLRALMAEISHVAAVRLTIGPCCSPRLTASEHRMLEGIAAAAAPCDRAHGRFAALLHARSCETVVVHAQALAACFADLGRPLNPMNNGCV